MHRNQQKQRHGPRLAIGLEQQRNADEHRVGLSGGKTGNHALAVVEPENLFPYPHGDDPDQRNATKIGHPIAPGLACGQCRADQRIKNQQRNAQCEHIIREARRGLLGQKAQNTGTITHQYQAKDRQHNLNEIRHAQPLSSKAGWDGISF